jgi:nicotinate-nucleotide adenylyltransferase
VVAPRIGILGGTLDPIHCGHLDAAIAARDTLALDRVLVLPSHVPPHRTLRPIASPYHRFAMAALAVNGLDRLHVSDEELCAPGPSYTIDTLERLGRAGYAASQIFFITGVDAFAEIETWRRYPDVLELAHFAVISRPGYALETLRERLPALASRMHRVTVPDGVPVTPSILLLPVRTTDVSSTRLRERLAGGESIAGLVPPLVERHILQHGLYRMNDDKNQ